MILVCSILFLTILCIMSGIGFSKSHSLLNYPASNSYNNRVLGMILSHNLGHIDPLVLTINEYVSMCESGWGVVIGIFTATHWSPALIRYFRQRSFCYRTNSTLPILIFESEANISTSLAAEHRKYVAREFQNYDVLIYHEDDILFKNSHLTAYLQETKHLYNSGGLSDFAVGFQRFRRQLRTGGSLQGPHFSEADIFGQEFLEETPKFRPVCIDDAPFLIVEGNIHQAMWILTNEQIKVLQTKCNFLNQTSDSREYMSSISLFGGGDIYHCAVSKLIPGERFMTFAVEHYYAARHPSWNHPLWTADEHVRGGYFAWATPQTKSDYYDGAGCWSEILRKSQSEQQI